jgi:hypothetical protein
MVSDTGWRKRARWIMFDWRLMLFWAAALSLGVATWWFLLSWFGLRSAIVAIALVALAATAGAALEHRRSGRCLRAATPRRLPES